jgi:phosphopantetheine--protein transferase-like protein
MISVGTDIVKVSRIKALIEQKKEKFLNKIFTEEEISYCNSYPDSEVHLSGKYAAKEAVKKALLSNDLIEHINLKDIKILNKENKAPYVVIDFVEFIPIHPIETQINIVKLNYSLSISHEDEYAIAFIVIEK